MTKNIMTKYKKLQEYIKELEVVAVAFSGGVDSTLLAKVSYDILKENAICITLNAAIHSREEILESKELTEKIGIKHIILQSDIIDTDIFKTNPEDRCYHCKKEIFSTIKKISRDYQCKYVLDGSNVDDLKDYRPGMKALIELDIKSPLKEVGLTKEEIRILSKELGLETWNKPAFACLASRIPYGSEINEKKLKMVERAESYIRSLGFNQLRVRHHGDICRVELEKSELNKVLNNEKWENINTKLKEIGFKYVTLDMEGYRMGSLNPQN